MALTAKPYGKKRPNAVLRSLTEALEAVRKQALRLRIREARTGQKASGAIDNAHALRRRRLQSAVLWSLLTLLLELPSRGTNLQAAVLRSLQQCRSQRSLLNTSLTLSLHKHNSGRCRHVTILVARLHV